MPKVLLADDSTHAQRMGTKILTAEGLEVVTVSNGEAAVKKLNDGGFDLVLADVFMPGRTGYEICEFVKSSGQHSHIPVVLVVGALEPYDPDQGKRVQADGLLKKPFEASAMLETVRPLLERAQAKKPAKKAVPVPAPPPPPAEEAEPEPEVATTTRATPRMEIPQEMADQPLNYGEQLEAAPAPVEAPPAPASAPAYLEEPSAPVEPEPSPEAAPRWVAQPAEVTDADRARFGEPAPPEERKPEAAPDWGELLKSIEEPPAVAAASESPAELESVLQEASPTFAGSSPSSEAAAAEAAAAPVREPELEIVPEPAREEPAMATTPARAGGIHEEGLPNVDDTQAIAGIPETPAAPAEAGDLIAADAAAIRDAVHACLERALPALVDEISSEVLRRLGR